MGRWLAPSDLTPFKQVASAKATAMIADVEALASVAAPCLLSEALSTDQTNAIKAILRAAVLRWDDAGSGALQQQTVGPMSMTVDTRQGRYGQLWPSEESALQKICKNGSAGRAYTVDMSGGASAQHQPWCAVAFSANYCSCGADIAGQPLWED